jgi:ABC-type branched-subunit amino acid transport system ATPase component/ABC-type branched-subunit amino acid transport system permease subunit
MAPLRSAIHSALMPATILGLTLAGLAMAVTSEGYTPFVLALVALATMVGVGLNVLVGLAGQISIGHVGFYAIGAYAVAVLTLAGVSLWLALPAAAIVAGLIGALLAVPAMRVTGPYLAMMTIAFAFIVEHVAIEWRDMTGGQNGLMGIAQPGLEGWLEGERGLVALSVAVAGLSLYLFHRLARGPLGVAMMAVRDSETAARAVGYNPVVVKTLAFALSAALTGLAGGLFASLMTFVAPSSFPFSQSILFLLAVVVGGAGYTLGPLLGAAIIVVLPELIASVAEYRLLMFGALLLAVLWLAPEGILGTVARFLPRRAARAAGDAGFDIASFLGRGERSPLVITGLTLAFGGVRAATDVALTAEPGEVTALIGPNGAGKTTVLNMIGGYYRPDAGSIRLGRRELAGAPAWKVARAGIARTYQTTQLFGSLSALDNVLAGARGGLLGHPQAASASVGQRATAEGLLAFVGFAGDLDAPAQDLPHVDRRLVEIARAVAMRPDVLLLDEPAAGLMHADKARLGGVLRKLAGAGLAVILVEHDMTLVMGVSDHVVVLDAGRPIAAGAPEVVRSDARVKEAYLGSGQMQACPRAHQLPPAPPLQLDAADLGAGYGAVPVLHRIALEVRQGELVALLGANGAGKSTTMRALSGLLRPASGTIRLGGDRIEHLEAPAIAAAGLVLVPEGRQVFPELTVRDNLLLGAHARNAANAEADMKTLLQRFPRLNERLASRAGFLSGGEQQMLALARGLMARPRVLLLDEPSLGLAPAIIEALFKAIAELRDAGITILLVDQMATQALAAADRGYVLESGRIVRADTAGALREDPALEAAYLGGVKAAEQVG